MRLLWIATKVPVPPVDGGRLVQKLTLEALAAEGVEVEVLAPLFADEQGGAVSEQLAAFCRPHLVPVRSRPLLSVLAAARPGGFPLAVARHAHAEVRRRAASLVAARHFDVVHVEQLHALPQAGPARPAGIPVVLRAQNVESDLWAAAASLQRGPARQAARFEARRLARWEGAAVRATTRTVALSDSDARRLEELAAEPGRRSDSTSVTVVAAPFPVHLDAVGRPPLRGNPAVVLLGSSWLPNEDAARFMVDEVWPAIHRRLPSAVLHVYGDGSGELARGEGSIRSVIGHAAPAESSEAFREDSILAVPLRVASGVRMKILEAWARGVPVVASPQAVVGLELQAGRELLVAEGPEEFAAAVVRLQAEPCMRQRLIVAGRAALARVHAPRRVANELLEVYRGACQVGAR